jgi:hypothetical protein
MSSNKTYNCGVYLNGQGEPVLFIRKPLNELPKACLEVKQVSGIDFAEHQSKLMLESWKDKLLNNPNMDFNFVKKTDPILKLEEPKENTLYPGRIAYFVDNDGSHISVILEPGFNISDMLFVTSNPCWNNKCRMMSEEEIFLLGQPLTNKTSYFAPVVRPNDCLVLTEKSYSKEKTKDLISEFLKK